MDGVAVSESPYRVVDPRTGKAGRVYPLTSTENLERALQSAQVAFEAWRHTSVEQRSEVLRALAEGLRSRQDELAGLMSAEMGKLDGEAQGEIAKCAWVCDYYAEQAPELLKSRVVPSDAGHSEVRFDALGLLLAVMPWNFPFWQVFRCLAPMWAAGNAVLLKHAPNVPGCAEALTGLCASVLEAHGHDPALVVNLRLGNEAVADLIADRRVRGVTLTGSTRAGRAVAGIAGSHLKKTVLELGGSDPYVILADADLEQAAKACVASRLLNGGQSCIAAKRWIVEAPVRGEFEALVLQLLKDADGRAPMARDDLRRELHRQVTASVDAGARLRLGGRWPDGPGFFYPVTLLTEVVPGMPAFDEELFGPVAALIEARDRDHAVELARASTYGLGAAVFSRDGAAAQAVADALETGSCFINDFVRSDPRLPFGGVKDSGYGRELGLWGFYEWVNVKTLWVRP